MPCIFGFGLFHNWFCPCGLLNVKTSDLNTLVCSRCESKFRSEYKSFMNDEEFKSNWDGDFEDFLSIHVEERLKNIAMMYPDSCEYHLTSKEYDRVSKKFKTMYDNFIDREEVKVILSMQLL